MTAKEVLNETAEAAYQKALEVIFKARSEGQTSAYLVAGDSCAPKATIERLLYNGYDIVFNRFHYGDWFIKIYWHDNVSGKIYQENDFDKFDPVSIEEMYSFEG